MADNEDLRQESPKIYGPRISDLRLRITMRTAIVSDIHGNLEAFTSVLDDIRSRQADRVISLGDNIGYGADSEEVVQLLIAGHIPSVLGNHEVAALDDKVLRWHTGDVRRALDNAIAGLSEGSFRYIRACPSRISEAGCLFVHGFPPDSCRLYLHQAGEEQLQRAFAETKEDLCFVGHTHRLGLVYFENNRVFRQPLDQTPAPIPENRKYIVNVGSVGQPRDGDNRARYVIWDSAARRIEIRAVAYDSAAAARKIIAAGIPDRFAAMITGK